MLLLILTRFVRRYKEFFSKTLVNRIFATPTGDLLDSVKKFQLHRSLSVLLSQHNCKKCLASNLTIHKLLPCETILLFLKISKVNLCIIKIKVLPW